MNENKLIERLRWWSKECDRTNFGCQARNTLDESADFIESTLHLIDYIEEWSEVGEPQEGIKKAIKEWREKYDDCSKM